jgi:hypothetical protein
MITDQYEKDFSQAIQESMSFLIDYGYKFVGITCKFTDELLGAYLIATFESASANRLVEITYIPKNITPREVALTRVLQKRLGARDDFDYLSTHSMKIEGQKIIEFNGEYSERLSAYLNEIASILQNKYSDVLLGKEWRPDQFDWQGLK